MKDNKERLNYGEKSLITDFAKLFTYEKRNVGDSGNIDIGVYNKDLLLILMVNGYNVMIKKNEKNGITTILEIIAIWNFLYSENTYVIYDGGHDICNSDFNINILRMLNSLPEYIKERSDFTEYYKFDLNDRQFYNNLHKNSIMTYDWIFLYKLHDIKHIFIIDDSRDLEKIYEKNKEPDIDSKTGKEIQKQFIITYTKDDNESIVKEQFNKIANDNNFKYIMVNI